MSDPHPSPGAYTGPVRSGPVHSGPVVGFDLDMTLVDSSVGIAETLRLSLA